MGGDWNVIKEKERDSKFHGPVQKKGARKDLFTLINSLNLFDPIGNDQNPRHTFIETRDNGTRMIRSSRLDYFEVSPEILLLMTSFLVPTMSPSDHKPIIMKLSKRLYERNPSQWKLNSSILLNDETCDEIRSIIINTKQEFDTEMDQTKVLGETLIRVRNLLRERGKENAVTRRADLDEMLHKDYDDRIEMEEIMRQFVEYESEGARIRAKAHRAVNVEGWKASSPLN